MHKSKRHIPSVIWQQNYLILFVSYFFVSFSAGANSPFYRSDSSLVYSDVVSFDYEKASHTIQLGTDADGLPEHYYARLITPVCDDSICEILHLEMYWDLLGNYMGFDTIPGYALTKYDHVKFTSQEYLRLHEILMDKKSALGELEMMDLVTNEEKHTSGVIDAASGATNVDIAGAVVKGGVYSCYILWHIANPLSQQQILRNTEMIMTPELKYEMLKEQNPRYRIYQFSKFSTEEYLKYADAVTKILTGDDEASVSYLINNMPDTLLRIETLQLAIAHHFSAYSVTDRYQLLMRMSSCHCVYPDAVETLAFNFPIMSYMQVQSFVEILNYNKADLTTQTLNYLKKYADEEKHKYAFLLQEFLELIN